MIKRPKTIEAQRYYEVAVLRLAASLAMSCHGAAHLSQVPPDSFKRWIGSHKTQDGLRWNGDLWRAGDFENVIVAIRSIGSAYARSSGNADVNSILTQKRSDVAQLRFWADLDANPPSHVEKWLDAFRAWRRSVKGRTASTQRSSFLIFARFLDSFDQAEVEDPVAFLKRKSRPSFADWLVKAKANGEISGRIVAPSSAVAEIKRFGEFFVAQLRASGTRATLWPLITKADEAVAASASKGRARKHAHAQSRPLPMHLYNLTREILNEGESGWPGKHSAGKSKFIGPDGVEREIYCPVMATLFLVEFELPLRVGQSKRFDSGEGDVRRFNAHTGEWEQNLGRTAGHWARRTPPAKDAGYAFEYEEAGFTGFWVNTNKTGEPYCIPWPNTLAHKLLYDLRVWQENYNPIARPIPPLRYVDDVSRAEVEKLRDLPDIFPLFRLPYGMGRNVAGAPPNARKTNQYWQDLMGEVQTRWNESHPEKQLRFVKKNEKGEYHGCIYKPHGLRVQLLTILFDAGIPIEVLSCVLAGHKTILMSIYYLVRDPAWYAEKLSDASRQRASVEQARALAELKGSKLPHAAKLAAALNSSTLASAVAMGPLEKENWVDRGIGICPFGGTRCHDGGKCLRKSTRPNGVDASSYAPVDGGPGNCVACRHFITGPAWLIALQILGTKTLRRLAGQQQSVLDLMEKMKASETARTQSKDDPARRCELDMEIERTDQQLRDLMGQQEITVGNLWKTIRYIEASKRLMQDAPDGGSSTLVMNGEGDGKVGFTTASDFEQAMHIVSFSEIYPILHDEEAKMSLKRTLERVVFEGQLDSLTLRPLSPDAVDRALFATSRYLLANLSREEMNAVSDGTMKLAALGHSQGAVAAAEVALGQPIQALKALNGMGRRPIAGSLVQ
jgi:hypothetical protein